MVFTFLGIGGGAKIILSHQFGSKNSAAIKASTDTAMITAAILGILIGIFLL